MKAEIIAIGSELTCGARTDTNSVWLSQELEARGWTVQRHTTVADDHDAMVKVFQDAAVRSTIVLVTGGLGPTLDDITRDTLAEAFHQPLVQDGPALQHIEQLFRSRGREMPERNKVQALRPANAAMISNAHGTAPGILMHLKERDCTFAVMPGVPAEMRLMFHEEVQHKLPASKVFVKRTLVRTFGLGESAVEGLLGDLTARGRNPEVGITASQAVISLSITARAASEAECRAMTDGVRDQIHERLGSIVFGEGDCQLHDVVVRQLAARNQKLALLEGSTTGGILCQWLTESADTQERLASGLLFPNEAALFASQQTQDTHQTQHATWQEFCRHHAAHLIETGAAQYVLISSPSESHTNSDGIASLRGHVLLVGDDVNNEQDVSMTGNLAIFRHRAARTALNLLRLHLTTRPSES